MSYVYESPDNGQTIYRREIGSNNKELHYETDEKKEKTRQQERWMKWRDILLAAKSDPELNKALSHVELLYDLSRE